MKVRFGFGVLLLVALFGSGCSYEYSTSKRSLHVSKAFRGKDALPLSVAFRVENGSQLWMVIDTVSVRGDNVDPEKLISQEGEILPEMSGDMLQVGIAADDVEASRGRVFLRFPDGRLVVTMVDASEAGRYLENHWDESVSIVDKRYHGEWFDVRTQEQSSVSESQKGLFDSLLKCEAFSNNVPVMDLALQVFRIQRQLDQSKGSLQSAR